MLSIPIATSTLTYNFFVELLSLLFDKEKLYKNTTL